MKMNRRKMNTGSAEIYQPLNKKKMLTRTPYKKAPSEKRRAWQKTQTRKIGETSCEITQYSGNDKIIPPF